MTRFRLRAPALPLLGMALSSCASAPQPPRAPTSAASMTDLFANDTRGAPTTPLAWATFDSATFAAARREHRFIILDGAAEWCHWCHVMEATTYHDAAVRDLIGAHFIAAKVDVDSRPDIEERYGDYGWPATVIFSPEGEELGKYRGYIDPEAFAEMLRTVVNAPVTSRANEPGANRSPSVPRVPLSEEALDAIGKSTERALAELYDDGQGGWGTRQKSPIATDNAWALSRARKGDETEKAHVLFTLDAQRKIIDPVWGGIYQYSAASDWNHPHFEKLMPYQAGALDNYADAYALTHDPKWLACANSMRKYIDRFLTSPEGGFYATQDADLNAHQAGARFMTGHEYYVLDDAHRRALGIPRIDTHEYGQDNGLAINAYVTLYDATGDASALATAERAAKRILETHGTPGGGIKHDADPEAHVLHLSDNAAFGFALVHLYEATKKSEWLSAATKIAEFMTRELEDKAAGEGAFFAHTVDPGAVGVFAVRRKPFEENVLAIRFLARLARAMDAASPGGTGAAHVAYAPVIRAALEEISTPEAIQSRRRLIGDFLQALDETRGVR